MLQVQWYYYDEDDVPYAFTQIANREIERAFQDKLHKIELEVFEDGQKHEIDIRNHRLKLDDDTKEISRVVIGEHIAILFVFHIFFRYVPWSEMIYLT